MSDATQNVRADGLARCADLQGQRKIVLVGPAHPFRGGIAHFADGLARCLERSGYQLRVLNFRRLYPRLFFPGRCQWEPDSSGDSVGPWACLDSLNPGTWFLASRRIAAEEPDAVMVQYWEPFLAPVFGTMARLVRRRHVKVLSIVHNAVPHEPRACSLALGRYALGACDEVIALSRSVENDLREVLRIQANVTRLFHPLYEHFGDSVPKLAARDRLRLPPNVPVVLFFGLVRKYKGLDVLLEALRRVAPVLPEIRLVVAGEFYEGKEKYCSFIRTNALGASVRLEDRYIPRVEVADYFCAADVVALPYLSGTQSGVVSAAYHFERPCIVSEAGGLPEMALEAGLTVRAGDPESLAEALVRFFSEGRTFDAAIRHRKETESWDRFGAALGALVESLPLARR